MNIRPIHTEQDYKDALKSVSALFDNEPEPGAPEGDYFDVMITLIEAYEAKHVPNRCHSLQNGTVWPVSG